MSLPPALAKEIARAAAREDTTVSAWLAATAARRLRVQAGLRALDEWDRESGPLTSAELAEGRRFVRESLGLSPRRRPKRTA